MAAGTVFTYIICAVSAAAVAALLIFTAGLLVLLYGVKYFKGTYEQ